MFHLQNKVPLSSPLLWETPGVSCHLVNHQVGHLQLGDWAQNLARQNPNDMDCKVYLVSDCNSVALDEDGSTQLLTSQFLTVFFWD